MRYRPDAPRGAMDFLFANTLTHLQSLGYQNFGLGMAPMSGMIDHPLASRWHRFGRLLFAHGEQFYNFRSEEHTSELQSLMRISYAVFCLKKKIPRNPL